MSPSLRLSVPVPLSISLRPAALSISPSVSQRVPAVQNQVPRWAVATALQAGQGARRRKRRRGGERLKVPRRTSALQSVTQPYTAVLLPAPAPRLPPLAPAAPPGNKPDINSALRACHEGTSQAVMSPRKPENTASYRTGGGGGGEHSKGQGLPGHSATDPTPNPRPKPRPNPRANPRTQPKPNHRARPRPQAKPNPTPPQTQP